MLKPWEYLFETHILARGRSYYSSGAVTSLERTGTGYKATVEGSYDYEVKVEIDDNEVVNFVRPCVEGRLCEVLFGKGDG